ncbi:MULTISPECIES: sigma-70 family RNA polymerase sigma factor [unclassified Caulobacter]|jgi:RNA polymerase sigma-70 factor (ECF subfamily)|uniref:sigma-70 family RNA polymerase sigma factor n=1 Tax=unclassified Caulobacter TaxID=2648921 RepID=UPI0008346AC4|nr:MULTISPECIES: sigma-70 family RNA polymerase sigma factor [unclassified Caulobacter]AZS21772.1 sigma-70 family RNA polymerase sigma factor [Caulobacter sp. FWC26]
MTTASRDKIFEKELVSQIPHLRAFARSLCGDAVQADDLAQDAVAKAWRCRESFELGTNMRAWTFMILRNQFLSEKRRSWRSVELDQERAEQTLVATDNPAAAIELDDVRQALMALPVPQREALIMVGAGGFSYEEAAAVMNVAIGTVKSRVNRARTELQRLLETGDYARDGRPVGEAMAALTPWDVAQRADVVLDAQSAA